MKPRLKPAFSTFVPIPTWSKYLWHLFQWNQVETKLAMFLNGGLWLARLDQFESFDVREGSLPKPNLGLLEMLLTPEQAAYTKVEYAHAASHGICELLAYER